MPTRARAQPDAADSARLASARAALLSFPLESPIRVFTVGHSVLEGRLAARSDTDVVIRHRADSARASVARVATIWRSAPNFKSGALVGGLVGGVLGGLVIGTLAAGLCDAADCHDAFARAVIPGAAVGGAVGAAIGLGVGALIYHWEQVWPKKTDRR